MGILIGNKVSQKYTHTGTLVVQSDFYNCGSALWTQQTTDQKYCSWGKIAEYRMSMECFLVILYITDIMIFLAPRLY
jgi:hypothetical protein